MITQIKLRRDTVANLNQVKLEEGEMAYDKTNKVVKVGDGATIFEKLPGFGSGFTQAQIEKFESEVPVVAISASGQFTITQQGKLLACKNPAAIELKIPVDTSPAWVEKPKIGCTIEIVRWAVGEVTIVAEAGVNLNFASAEPTMKLREEASVGAITMVELNKWLGTGDLK